MARFTIAAAAAIGLFTLESTTMVAQAPAPVGLGTGKGAIVGTGVFTADKPTQALTGLSNAEVRRSRAQSQGSTLWLEFVEFRGVDRTPLRMKIQDRGAARLQLRTENIDAMVNAVKRAGLTVVTQGAVAVPIPPNFKGALVADPNNFFVSLFEPCDGCAPRTPPSQ